MTLSYATCRKRKAPYSDNEEECAEKKRDQRASKDNEVTTHNYNGEREADPQVWSGLWGIRKMYVLAVLLS